jgi:hypothetical protein
MSVIDPKGLFKGERLALCSNEAQLHWPRLFFASNSLGRLELNYKRIIDTAYVSFSPKPSEEDISKWISEYSDNFLMFVYQASDGSLWGEWISKKELLSKYQSAEDRRSPAPDQDAIEEYRHKYVESKKANSIKINSIFQPHQNVLDYPDSEKSEEILENFSDYSEPHENVPIGIGIGVGIGVKEKSLSRGREEGWGDAKNSPSAKNILEEFVDAWNALRENLPQVAKFTEGRQRKLRSRIANGLTLERFKQAVICCTQKPHLRGDNGWMADFDWLIKNDVNIEKAINNPYASTNKHARNEQLVSTNRDNLVSARTDILGKIGSPDRISRQVRNILESGNTRKLG